MSPRTDAQGGLVQVLDRLRDDSARRIRVFDLTQRIVSERSAVADGQWRRLRDLSRDGLGVSGGRLTVLIDEAAARRRRISSFREMFAAFGSVFASNLDADSDGSFIQTLRQAVDAQPKAHRTELRALIDRLASGSADTKTVLAELEPARDPAGLPVALAITRAVLLAGFAKGLLGIVHGEFNLMYSALERNQPSLAIDALARREVDGIIDQFQRQLEERQRSVYASLGSSNGTTAADAVGASAGELMRFVETELAGLAQLLAAAAYFIGQPDGPLENGRRSALGRAAARGGAVVREAIASHIGAAILRTTVIGLEPPDRAAELATSAAALPFAKPLPNGRNVALADVGGLTDGDFVEVEGTVSGLRVLRADQRKLVSRVQLTGPTGDAAVEAAALFTHLPHAGVTRDSYARLTGTFRRSSPLLAKRAGLEIDRLALSDLARQSWRTALYWAASPWFEVWRNGTNLTWSLGPHRVAEGNEISRIGAAEIIFTPLVRR